jgi:hypothetical protein
MAAPACPEGAPKKGAAPGGPRRGLAKAAPWALWGLA